MLSARCRSRVSAAKSRVDEAAGIVLDMVEVSGGQLRSLGVSRGHWGSAEVTAGHQRLVMSAEVTGGDHRSVGVIGDQWGHQMSLGATRGHWAPQQRLY